MKRYTVLVGLLALAPTLIWAQAAPSYASKCAVCHGAKGEGKGANPKLVGSKMSQADIAAFLTNGKAGNKPPHAKGIPGLTADQAKAIAAEVKAMK